MLVYPNPTASVAPSALVFGIVFGMCVHSKGSHGLLLTVRLVLLPPLCGNAEPPTLLGLFALCYVGCSHSC